MTGFGQHLMIDGYGCSRECLDNIELIYNFLDTYPEQINMTKIMPPYVFRYNGGNPEDRGISGFVLIAESHISIHTFPEKNYLSLDIFSCKKFDTEMAEKDLQELFQIQKLEKNVLSRGSEFPKKVRMAKRFVSHDRLRIIGGRSRIL